MNTSEITSKTIARAIRSLMMLLVLGALGLKANAQMAIPGKFDVSPIGAATYTIPIQVPPGVAGMEPKLALSYNSRGGNGLLGVGWTLNGLPTITRCPRTTPQDGVKGGVAYDANDRFCLDGKRLMVVSGTYGAAGSSYRTEIETFANVTAYGAAGSGPQYFTVKAKDGLTMEFGNSADSRINVAGISTVRVWSLNKVYDSVGNTQSIVYSLPAPISGSTTEYNLYPLRIDYTSNSITGLLATNSVEFTYASRPDAINAYRGGYPFKTSVRLASLTTKVGGSTALTYTPEYVVGVGNRSAIASISLCGVDALCAAKTQFSLGRVGGSPLVLPTPQAALSIGKTESTVSEGQWVAMDVNGDGKSDLVHLTATVGAYRVWQANDAFVTADDIFSIHEYSTNIDTDLAGGSWQVLDFDGDGRADLVHLTATPGLIYLWKSNGDGTFAVTSFSTSADTALSAGQWRVLDVNGDGLPDLIHLMNAGQEARIWKSNGNGTFAISTFVNAVDPLVPLDDWFVNAWQVLDANGDGLADLVHLYRLPNCSGGPGPNCGVWMSVWKSNGDGTFAILRSTDPKLMAFATAIQIDVNGDGFSDLVLMQSNTNPDVPNSHAQVLTSKGDGAFDVAIPFGGALINTSLPDHPVKWGTWHVMDADGDGLPDLLHTPTGLVQGIYWIYRSNGDGTFAISQANAGAVDSCTSYCLTMRDGDFLGIGAPGFVHIYNNTVKSAWLLSSTPANVVTGISDGVGGDTKWDIAALPTLLRRNVYFKDIPSDDSTWTIASAIPVVETVRSNTVRWQSGSSQSDKIDRTTYYTYGSARVERNGRGFIGFSWQQSEDALTGIKTRNQFRQDFPFTGLVLNRSTGRGGLSNNLGVTATTYGCTHVDGGSACLASAGKRYFIYPVQTDSQSWDLTGTALPGTRVVNAAPDLYGNLGSTVTSILNPDGAPTDYSQIVTNTYYNDPTKWYLGRLVKTVVATSGPAVAAPVTPGSGNLPPAQAPSLPLQVSAALTAILQLLLSDD